MFMAPEDLSQTSTKAFPPSRAPLFIATVVTTLVAYQLYRTAQQTGNYEGMVFSLIHTVIVAAATVIALRAD